MNLNDLNSLKLAIDTGNTGFYHGNIKEALNELVEELITVHACLQDASSDFDIESVSELVSLYNGALNEVARLEDKEPTVMEIDFLTCKIEGVERITERVKTFENLDPEHPVKVIIKELL